MTSKEHISIRESLGDIKKKRGMITPDIVVEEAKSASHRLHNRFEWDNDIAGPAFRKEQARTLIQEVEISYVKSDGSKGRVREYYSVKRDNVYQYESLEDIKANPVSQEIVLAQMEREWRDLESKYESFQEFWTLVGGEVEDKQFSTK
jgi:hypothetical protein